MVEIACNNLLAAYLGIQHALVWVTGAVVSRFHGVKYGAFGDVDRSVKT